MSMWHLNIYTSTVVGVTSAAAAGHAIYKVILYTGLANGMWSDTY